MAVILAGCRYFGRVFRCARKNARMTMTDCARLFGVSTRIIRQYETGTLIIPDNVLQRLMYYGFLLLRVRNMSKPQK